MENVIQEPLILEANKLYDTLIIGAGPAGLNAGLYLKRKGLDIGIIGRGMGGQVADTSTVENYLGHFSITGFGLVEQFQHHVVQMRVPFLQYYGITKIEKQEDGTFLLSAEDEKNYLSKSLIIATGVTKRKLGIPGEEQFTGRGVTYCATCDGPLYRNQVVAVAGGGNSAVEAAIDLSKVASKVHLIHRSTFRADKVLLDQLHGLENVEIHLGTVIEEVKGKMGVDSLLLKDKESGETSELELQGLFVEIGNLPNNELVKDLVALSDKSEILVDEYCATNVEGIYAAGDVTTMPYKQIITAAAQGATAALAVNDYFNTKTK